MPSCSLGERYGLRIIPGSNSFLVLPNSISRSTAIGAVLHPGGPAHVPLIRGMTGTTSPIRAAGAPVISSSWLTSETADTTYEPSASADFVLAIGKDEKLMRRLNELDNAETVFTGEAVRVNGVQVGQPVGESEGVAGGSAGSGTDVKWKVKPEEIFKVISMFAEVEPRK